jgi:molecular chaperone DnaK (HSP70)
VKIKRSFALYNIAIDFGTSNTLIGVYDITTKEVKVESFSDISKKLGEYSVIPSIISYETLVQM